MKSGASFGANDVKRGARKNTAEKSPRANLLGTSIPPVTIVRKSHTLARDRVLSWHSNPHSLKLFCKKVPLQTK